MTHATLEKEPTYSLKDLSNTEIYLLHSGLNKLIGDLEQPSLDKALELMEVIMPKNSKD